MYKIRPMYKMLSHIGTFFKTFANFFVLVDVSFIYVGRLLYILVPLHSICMYIHVYMLHMRVFVFECLYNKLQKLSLKGSKTSIQTCCILGYWEWEAC